ncbi:ADP-ribosylhydrolase ARH3-like [Oratosquilla oratoria]|uniref:ADP-ribosylhydrolase ARH3-like n=1 Tax=Oratosquilla oratoria TaxID=337810 RepID=UPI003F75CEC0
MLASRFRGCLVGAVLGDCLGAPFEAEPPTTKRLLNQYFTKLADPRLNLPFKRYTDDTAMTRCVAQSLIDKKAFDAKDMAIKFVKEYFAEPGRGYGGSVVEVFANLRASKFKDVYASAGIQFGGRGSYGNGGAMRVAPVALFGYSLDKEEVFKIAKESTQLTHSNRLGYNGAVLQVLAVHKALLLEQGTLKKENFLRELIEEMEAVEKIVEEDILDEGENPIEYVERLKKVKSLLDRGEEVTEKEVDQILGVSIVAPLSVPTAIYTFLRIHEYLAESENQFLETIKYAISLGGDTDTIASMAGSIAGAYYGIEKIPHFLQKHCEGVEHAISQADQLLEFSSS